MKITKRELRQMINESVYDALNENHSERYSIVYSEFYQLKEILNCLKSHVDKDLLKIVEKAEYFLKGIEYKYRNLVTTGKLPKYEDFGNDSVEMG